MRHVQNTLKMAKQKAQVADWKIKTVDELKKLNLPAGVDISIKI